MSHTIKFFGLLFLLIQTEAFRTCDQVSFCKNLRNISSENRYTATNQRLVSENTIEIDLNSNNESENLVLVITAQEESTFRLKIKEVNSTRYELIDALENELQTISFNTIISEDDYILLKAKENSIEIIKSPLEIKAYKNDVLEVVVNGDRLLLENDESSQAFSLSVQFPQATQAYGIPEHLENLALKSTVESLEPYHLKNVDYGGWDGISTQGLYGSVPLVYGHGLNVTAGIFLHNAAEQWVDITNSDDGVSTHFLAGGGTLDLFILLGPKPKDVTAQYLELTGTSHLPQLWTLGYHQSRFSYTPQEKVTKVIAGLDNHEFSVDSIWLDIDYTDSFKYFTWNPETFYDPLDLQSNLSSTNRKLVTIIDPHIKVDENYDVYTGAREKGLFVKNADKSNFEGDCWPGMSSYMDFLNPEARDFYANYYSYDLFPNTTPIIAGIWNDMNEPSVFNIEDGTMPDDALHYGDVKHLYIHNIYGLLHTKATYQGLLQRDNNTIRPFILSRSTFAGSQRYVAHWTGDVDSDWKNLQLTNAMCLNANLVGIVFCGSDVGGFRGNPDDELLQRWYQLSAWQSFYRSHATKYSNDREPYCFSKDVRQVIREAIQTRYKHIPTWYTLFYEYSLNKQPIVRPLFYEYPNDENVFRIDDHILVGPDILVRPVVDAGVSSVQVYFPGGDDEFWVSPDDLKVYRGRGFTEILVDIHTIPYFYRGGSIIVRKDTVRRNTFEMKDDNYTLYVTLDKNGQAKGTVYIDDGESFKYRDEHEFNYFGIKAITDTIIIYTLDGYDDQFELNIEKIVFLEADVKSKTVEKSVYYEDAKGNLLADIKFDVNKKVKLSFNKL